MNTRLKEAARETAVLFGMWAVAACGLMLIAQRSPSPRVYFTPAPSLNLNMTYRPTPPTVRMLPASWRPDGATMLAQAKAAHRVYAPQSQVAARQPLRRVKWSSSLSLNTSPADAWGTPPPLASLDNYAVCEGTVTRVFVYPSNTLTCLNFAADYRKAVVAVVKPANYGKFPDLRKLVGKRVVFRGRFLVYRDPVTVWRPEIELKSPDQIQIVK